MTALICRGRGVGDAAAQQIEGAKARHSFGLHMEIRPSIHGITLQSSKLKSSLPCRD